ncbi:Mu-like prophage protein gp46 [Methylomagnum ishizawai]|uniref:Mu-like prophage protein gp46 n=1 Tax=Methylomagnum ishizawai TaxID=1760988 RepID=A0A1Y6CUP6_9GAMM|nr:phage GP46 family protein [Methylomagnum ishizawai]SMF94358.1 Mu-like prophage protein gp46 [Methylomagnum ishizawai]
MSDIAIRPDGTGFDFGLLEGDLEMDATLETAIWISLFTDRRLPDDQALPPGVDDRRGCWMDAYPEVPGDAMGSLLWLLAYEKWSEPARQKAEAWAREALQWLLDDGVAEAVDVVATLPRPLMLGLAVAITDPAGRVSACQTTAPWPAA